MRESSQTLRPYDFNPDQLPVPTQCSLYAHGVGHYVSCESGTIVCKQPKGSTLTSTDKFHIVRVDERGDGDWPQKVRIRFQDRWLMCDRYDGGLVTTTSDEDDEGTVFEMDVLYVDKWGYNNVSFRGCNGMYMWVDPSGAPTHHDRRLYCRVPAPQQCRRWTDDYAGCTERFTVHPLQ